MSPSVISVTATSTPSGTHLRTGSTVTFTLTVDAPVQVTVAANGSTPALVLSNGASASYVGINAAGTALTFGYTVAAGEDTADVQVIGLDLNGASIGTLGSDSTFQAPQQHNTGLGPESVVVKDVNGDGNADLVTANYRSATVSVLLSDSVGGFGAKADFTTGNDPQSVVVEDVNGDGNTDLVVANAGSASVSVLLGDGVGGFSAKTDFTTGSTPGSVAVADVNADGKADLVTANPGDTVSVLLGDGLGGFVRTDFAAGARPESVAVADVNGDGNLDLVTANSYNGTVSVLLGDGLGGFGARTDYATGNNSQSVVVEDVNGDGNADLLVANTDSNTVSVLLNNGLGGFGVKTDYATGVGPRSVAAADVDGDGNLDLVTANSASDTVSILLGDGVGGFVAKTDLATGDNPLSVAVADVNGDGRADLVTANVNSSTVSVLLGTGTPLDASGLAGLAGSDTGLKVDTIAPSAPSALAIASGSDSGAVGDGVTNVGKPVITGTAEAGSTVALFDGASLLGTVLAGGTGQWSFTPGTALAQGGHSITAAATDAAGNVSAASVALPLTIDTVLPSAPSALALAPASDSGAVGDGVTNVSKPVITGTAEAGSTVALFDGASLLGTVLAGGTGQWSFTPGTALAQGGHSITAAATDAAGNVSAASVALPLTIDTTIPPAPSGLTLAPASDSGISGDGVTSDSTPTLTGTAEAGSTVTLTSTNSGVPFVLGTVLANGAGVWSFTPGTTLADGAYSIIATSTDAAGNLSAPSNALALTFDATAPAVTVTLAHDTGLSATDRVTFDPTLTGSGDPGAVVTLTESGTVLGITTADASGTWSFTPTLADGTHMVVASETDAAGSAGTAATSFALDTRQPVVAGVTTSPSAGGTVGIGQSLTLALGISESVTVAGGTPRLTLSNGGVATYDPSASTPASLAFTYTVAPGQDTTDLRVTGVTLDGFGPADAAGNMLDGSAVPRLLGSDTGLVVDTVAPVVTAAAADNPQSPLAGLAYAQVLAGGGDPGAGVTISENGEAIGTAQADAMGAWTYDPSGLAPGAHALVASETDAAGNTGSTAAIPFTVADTRFGVVDVTASTSGSLVGSDYDGPVSYLQAQYIYDGSDDVVIGAKVANVFIRGSTGMDALAAKAGSNVLDGGAGSNWLVGADGADGGTDTFFVDGRGGQSTWDTLLNFHTGDMLTLWGFDAATGSMSWSDNQGAAGYQGATLHADFGSGSGASALVTFAELATSGAQFATSTGTSGGLSYLAVTRTA